ncbi:MAG: GDSL family lipase [Candidatus Nealsonbacteria bacterium]|nr:GDSL family lipase [Candidatus Nealsonbacteria bacterium]
MRLALRQFLLLLTVLIVLGCVRAARVAAEEAIGETTEKCAAATPVENPWTKRLPKGWWQKRHEDVLSAPGREACQIIFIGDSITDGWDATGQKIWAKEYVPLKVLNLGINCDSTQHVLWRLDHGEIDGLPKLKVAVIEIGTNNVGITRDPPQDIVKGVEAICERVKHKAPHAKILLLAIFPKGFGANRHDVANGLISKLDDGKQIFYLNINDALLETEGAIADRVGHLTEKGYEVWANAIRPTLEKLMQYPPSVDCLEREAVAVDPHSLGWKMSGN